MGDLAGGARRTILGCDGPLGSDLAGSLLVSACAVAPLTPAITPGPVELRNLATPAAPPVQLAPAGIDPKIAGTMVGWRTGTTGETIVVRDTARDVEVQRITAKGISAWSLQGDGKIAFVQPDPTGATMSANTVSWAIPGDPAIRSFGSPLPVRGLRLLNDQLAFERVGVETELALRPLAGPERVVARYVPPQPRGFFFDGPGFDFDGTGLLVARARCGRSEVVRHPLGAPADIQRVDLCPLQPATTAKVSRRGRASMDVTCPRLTPRIKGDSCRVKATLRSRGRRLATATRTVLAGQTGALRFSVAARLLRTRPGRVTVRLESRMRGGTDRRTVTVRPAYPKRRSRGA